MRNVLSVTTAMLVAVLPSACASNTAPDGVTVPPPPPRPATTTISVFQQGRHEGELVVPTCGAERRGFVAPVRRVRVRGRFPTDRDIDVPPNLFHHYQALGEDTVSVMVLGAGVCDGGAIRPACTATVRDQTILVEANMCCESRPVTSLYGNLAEPPTALAECKVGRLGPGTYSLFFRSVHVATFAVPSTVRSDQLSRTFPLLPPPPDAGPPLDSASE
jgi:hypothetical protein